MEVILIQNVDKLGKVGEIVKVKDGYARNLLLPKKLAHLATAENKKKIELQRKKLQDKYDQEKQEADALSEKLSKVSVTVNVEVNDLDRLYGSITESEVVAALNEEGFSIDKKDIVFEKPIEELGIFEVGVQIHSDVLAKFRLWVTKK